MQMFCIDIKLGPDDQPKAGRLHDRLVGHGTECRVRYETANLKVVEESVEAVT